MLPSSESCREIHRRNTDGRKVQVWQFVSQGLNIGKWSTGKHCDGVAVVKKKRENHYVSRRWHPSFKDCRSLNATDEMNCPMPRSVEKVPFRNEKRCM